ncbi:hypothetical protein WAI453_013476 [Rhynchosporium graminicola]
MRADQNGPNTQVEIQDVSVPKPVLLKPRVTGLCMSDIPSMRNDWNIKPLSMFGVKCAGHEGAAVVVKSDADVQNWKFSNRGGIKPLLDFCCACELCCDGKDNYCQKGGNAGLAATGSHRQYIVSPAKFLTLIPDIVIAHVAGPIMCSASTMHRAFIDAFPKVGQ